MSLSFNQTTFLKSAFKPGDFPPDSHIEIAFAGRSNVGKSSTLNLLTGKHKLARISKTPGRTTSINFFILNESSYLVDLPGYGYAKVSHTMKAQWQKFLQIYILKRVPLKGIILVMDCRHPFTELDQVFLDLCHMRDLPCHILLNKADKLSNNGKSQILQKIVKPILLRYANLSVQFFSAAQGLGLDELKQKMAEWMYSDRTEPNVTQVT